MTDVPAGLVRRRFLASLAATVFFGSTGIATRDGFASTANANRRPDAIQASLVGLEAAAGGRLGVHILDTATGPEYGYRSDERFMMLSSFKLVLGDALAVQSRHRLKQWLLGSTTGGKRLKACLPTNWQIGDKTGTNKTNASDIGVMWPPNRAPVVMAAYLSASQASSQVKDATIVAVGRTVQDIAV